MPSFTFTFPATSPSGKPAPTKAQLATYERVLSGALGATALTLTLADNGDNTGKFTVTGTTDDLEKLKEKVDEALDDLPPMAGWVASGRMEGFGEGVAASAAGRRRSSAKRGRKVTRRHRKRKGSRKLGL